VPTTVGPFPGLRPAPLVVVAVDDKRVYLERYAQPDKGWQDRAEEFQNEAALQRYLDVFETFAREVTGG
jgi:hypothetical protein